MGALARSLFISFRRANYAGFVGCCHNFMLEVFPLLHADTLSPDCKRPSVGDRLRVQTTKLQSQKTPTRYPLPLRVSFDPSLIGAKTFWAGNNN